MKHCIMQACIMKHCIMKHCIMKHCVMQHCIMQHCIMQHCIMEHARRGTTPRATFQQSGQGVFIINNRALLYTYGESTTKLYAN